MEVVHGHFANPFRNSSAQAVFCRPGSDWRTNDGSMRLLRSGRSPRERALFVGAGEPALADDIRDQDRRKFRVSLIAPLLVATLAHMPAPVRIFFPQSTLSELCDLVSLRIEDIAVGGCVKDRATIVQHKTGRRVQFEITEQTRVAPLYGRVRQKAAVGAKGRMRRKRPFLNQLRTRQFDPCRSICRLAHNYPPSYFQPLL
jgi:hypothetical protein